MGKKIARFFITLMGLFVGPGLVALVFGLLRQFEVVDLYADLLQWVNLLIFVSSGLISGIVFFFLSNPIVNAVIKASSDVEKRLSKLPAHVLFPSVIGLILGLIVAFLLSSLVNSILIPWISGIINVIIYIVCIYLGIAIMIRYKPDLSLFRKKDDDDKDHEDVLARPKLLDTSVIIDGRIFDICNTGVIEGALIIPEFVLDELRHIADSSDDLKRNRGRRGLDVLKRIQTELDMPVRIVHAEISDSKEVDSKLLYLARDMDGIVVTNDYNLNKVAAVQSVRVLNINELANAVKPVVLPGEEMSVTIVKEGKEQGQGIAYLDDGTMIVVESASGAFGKPISVTVTSVLQTAAGRMIFAKIK